VKTDLEEVEMAAKVGSWRAVALEGRLAYHNHDKADQGCQREQHRREDTRKTPDFAHACIVDRCSDGVSWKVA